MDARGEAAVDALVGAAALWRLHPREHAQEVLDAAIECLVADIDPLAVCELAGESSDRPARELEPLVEAALTAVGRGAELAADPARTALRVMARRLDAGLLSPPELVSWAWGVLAVDPPPWAPPFAELGEAYDLVLEHPRSPVTVADVDAAVRGEAAAYARGHPSPGLAEGLLRALRGGSGPPRRARPPRSWLRRAGDPR